MGILTRVTTATTAALRRVLTRELERHHDPRRASEAVYAFAYDQTLEPRAVLEVLHAFADEPVLAESARGAMRLFTENETLEVLTRERVLLRRAATREDAVQLARSGDVEGLRRISGRNLQLALTRAKPPEATAIIGAWNQLPLYEQERPT